MIRGKFKPDARGELLVLFQNACVEVDRIGLSFRFELNDEKNLLTLCLMVRGEERGLSGEPVKNRGCPDDFVAQWDAAAYPCALYAFRFVWRLPNAGGRGAGL